MNSPAHERALLNAPSASLLVAGGDGRMALDPISGLNKYGCAPLERDVLALGSCTASSPTGRALKAVHAAKADLLQASRDGRLVEASHEMMREIRMRVARSLRVDGVENSRVVLTPSGTDAEMLATLLAVGDADEVLCNIVVAPSEVGSGTVLAAAGRHFDGETPRGGEGDVGVPVSPATSARIRVETVPLRDGDGVVRSEAMMDAACTALAKKALARGERVLLHLVAHSKTGAHAPSLECVRSLRDTAPDRVCVLVDAAQGRISRRGLKAALEEGWMVLFTGSKFYGGPPFSGALLIPASCCPNAVGLDSVPAGFRDYFTAGEQPTEWFATRSTLSQQPNLGLVLRWTAALAEIDAYYAIAPERRYEVLRFFEKVVVRVFSTCEYMRFEALPPPISDDGETPLLESKQTVFSFYVRAPHSGRELEMSALRRVFSWLNRDLSRLPLDLSEEARGVLKARFHLGQPVATSRDGERGLLRIALGAALLVDLAGPCDGADGRDDRLEVFERQLTRLRAKLGLIVDHFDAIARHGEGVATEESTG